MKRTRFALVSLLSAVALALAVESVAAQPSTTAELINELNLKLLYVAVPITLLVEVILLYTVLKFRNNDSPKPTRENRRLEITWTIATAIILLFVGVASYGVLANPDVTYLEEPGAEAGPSEGDVVVRAEAFQWGWEMSYPRENVTSGTNIVLPQGQDVYIQVTSRDVIHAFHVPEMGLKMDAFPGKVQTIKTTPLETGEYQGYCAEYCGVAHSQMYFTVEVVPQDQYQQWLQEQRQSQQGGGDGGNESAGGNGNQSADGNESGGNASASVNAPPALLALAN
ncbi:cytochrome c oxidase subunit II [Halegenticoccus soli]|uniref:cytochrome c oxidase subunit II n=1 Tax=Halegenticoccus soli TaxID=1985678 RepID=UPI000C6E4829|nr:cytochrome c oxidase subunit II [Halegenticoccus soli]